MIVPRCMIDVFMTESPTRLWIAFMCSHSRLAPAAPKLWKKKELETDFDYFGIISITNCGLPISTKPT